jgi:hypothetical protein
MCYRPILGLVGGGGGHCGIFYRSDVIEIVATNEVGTWAQRVVKSML